MADFIKTQNSFENGEVAPEFYARDNINGLSKLENMDVLAGGGLSRRCGLRSIDKLVGFSHSSKDSLVHKLIREKQIQQRKQIAGA